MAPTLPFLSGLLFFPRARNGYYHLDFPSDLSQSSPPGPPCVLKEQRKFIQRGVAHLTYTCRPAPVTPNENVVFPGQFSPPPAPHGLDPERWAQLCAHSRHR